MKINPITNCHNFGMRKLNEINIKEKQPDGSYQLAPASFAELEQLNIKDIELIEKIGTHWYTPAGQENYTTSMCRNFFKIGRYTPTRRFFVVQAEKPDLDSFSKTVTLMETTNPEFSPTTFMEVSYIQSATSLLQGFCKVKAKGAGEQAICGIVKFAQNYPDVKDIRIFSTNDGFYEKIGFKKQKTDKDGTYFILKKSDFDSFIQKTKEKYS